MSSPSTPRDRYQRIKALLLESLELEPAARAAFLDEVCSNPGDAELRAEVEQLLQYEDDRGDGLDVPSPQLPERIGRYRIIRLLGEGGMGSVYEAEQDVPHRRVALKVIRRALVSPAMQRRFGREVELLGRLQHRGIAGVYDAGITPDADAIPYLAMELINGQDLRRWLLTERPSRVARIQFLVELCEAVEHAHRHGVIHRDLKPSNVMVDADGHPKVLDFGIARAVDQGGDTALTAAHQLLGTLAYMSPEQCAGDPSAIETGSDVYALGVIAYETLTGKLPRDIDDVPITEAIRRIREDDAVPLGSHDRQLRGDLQTVVHRALAFEPRLRYASAALFGDDLRRILASEPVLARPASTTYIVSRFVRRHRVLVGSVVFAFVALATGTAVAVREAAAERDARLEAEAARVSAENALEGQNLIHEFMLEMLGAASPLVLGPDANVRQLLDHSRPDVERRFADRADLRAAVHGIFGHVYNFLGEEQIAREEDERAVAALRACGDAVDLRVLAAAVDRLTGTQLRSKRLDEAAVSSAEAMSLAAQVFGKHSHEYVRTLLTKTSLDLARRQFGDVAATLDELTALASEMPPLPDRMLAQVHNRHGHLALSNGDWTRGIDELGRSLELIASDTPAERHERAQACGALAVACMRARRFEEATSHMAEQLRLQRELLGDSHPSLAVTISNLGSLARSRGDLAAAEGHYREALAISRRATSGLDPGLAINLNNLGALLGATRRAEEAIPLLEESVGIAIEVHGEQSPAVAGTLGQLAACHRQLGERAVARDVQRRALDAWRAVQGPAGAETIAAEFALLTLDAELGDLAAARAPIERLIERTRGISAPQRRPLLNAMARAADGLVSADATAAAQLARAAVGLVAESFARGDGRLQILTQLGGILRAAGDHATATEAFTAALESASAEHRSEIQATLDELASQLETTEPAGAEQR